MNELQEEPEICDVPDFYPIVKAVALADLVAATGEEELIKTRFLCRGAGMLLVGPTGIGKSSLMMQLALCWSIGRGCFGFTPSRPLRSLIIQSENDNGDLLEMRDGVLAGLSFSAEETQTALSSVHVVKIDDKTGLEFLTGIVRPLVNNHKPDVLWVDPLMSYLGGDVGKQETVSAFLRTGLNPIIHEAGCAVIILHHCNKPAIGREKSEWSGSDFAYLGSGSADLANWSRAVVAIRSLGSNEVFELRVGKRGSRLGWIEEDGTTRRYALPIAHDRRPGVICWRKADPDEVPDGPGRKPANSVQDILDILNGKELSTTEWQTTCETESGISKRTFHRLKSAAEKSKLVTKSVATGKWGKTR